MAAIGFHLTGEHCIKAELFVERFQFFVEDDRNDIDMAFLQVCDHPVHQIGAEAFSELTSLTSYTGPMKHLNAMAKGKLTSVTLVASEFDKVEFITFYGCESLTEITYTGTMEAWQALDKADGWLTSLPEKTLVVHCTDGDVVEK